MDSLLEKLYLTNAKSGHEEAVKQIVRNALCDANVDIREDSFGNLLITKGKADSFPCVAAHLDEVHAPENLTLHEVDGRIYATNRWGEPAGIGADDKNGVWIAIQLLLSEPDLKVALFVQEEKDGDIRGCRGSGACSLEFFQDVRYVLECDRKGASDVVCIGKDFMICDPDFIHQDLLEQYGFQMVKGGSTDVVKLRIRGLEKQCCNISCGYYNAHKAEEYTMIGELYHSLDFVRKLIHTM